MSTANQLIEVLGFAKTNMIDVQIKELDSGEISCTCTADVSESFTVDSLDQLVRRIKMLVEDWQII